MNIFVLSEDPIQAASFHCDQHLHKMILESAQMLSTAAHARQFSSIFSWLYKPAYPKHPCTVWASKSNHNMHWLCALCEELNSLRANGTHSSMDVVWAVRDYLEEEFPHCHYRHVDSFVFAGPAFISLNNSLTITQKYQAYYAYKHRQWALDKGKGMSYKDRLIPPFMTDVLKAI